MSPICCANSSVQSGRKTAKRSPAMRAASAPGRGFLRSTSATLPISSSPTCMPKLSLTTCMRSTSMYSTHSGAGCRRAASWPRTWVSKAERVSSAVSESKLFASAVVVLRASSSTRRSVRASKLGAPSSRNITRKPDHAAGGVADRRAEDLVGRELDRTDLDLVDHEVAPLQLHPVEQVPVDLGQDLDLWPLAARRLADRDAALGHDQGAEQAAEVVHAGLHHDAELVARLRVVRVLRAPT